MKTTINMDDRLFDKAKKRASDLGIPMTKLVELAVQKFLGARREEKSKFTFKPLTMKGRLLPGVDLADRNSLYDLMESRKL